MSTMPRERDAADRMGHVPAPKPKLTPPNGPPVPALAQHGFWGSIDQFAARVQEITDRHERQRGYRPKPDVVFQEAVRPRTDAFDRRPTVTDAYDRRPELAVPSDDAIVEGLADAARKPFHKYQAYFNRHAEDIRRLQRDRKHGSRVNAIINAEVTSRVGRREQKLAKASMAEPPRILGLAAYQIASSLIFAPAGLAIAGWEVGEDMAAAQLRLLELATGRDAAGRADLSFRSSRTLGGAIVEGYRQDFTNPGENPGYLFLDLLGLASLGAGTAVRGGQAAKAARLARAAGDASTLRAAGRAFRQKPPLRRAEVRLGDYTEDVLLSSNPLVAKAQEIVLGARQARADARWGMTPPAQWLDLHGNRIPTESMSILVPQWAEDVWAKHLGFERKLSREAAARQRVEYLARMTSANELQAVAGTALAHSRVWGRLPVTVKNGLTRGEQKAIQAASWDVPGDLFRKIAAERQFHRRMIEEYADFPQIVKDHRRHLADLDLAEVAVKSPRPKFTEALRLTEEVIAEQEWARIGDLGLLPSTAEGRVAKAGQVLRGEEVVGGQRQTPDSFYLPTQPRGKVKRGAGTSRGYPSVSAGPYGVPRPRDLPETNHEFTGKAMVRGDFRIDATNLAGEAAARTYAAVGRFDQYRKLLDSSFPEERPGTVPIRLTEKISDELREALTKLDEGEFTSRDAGLLPADDAAILRELYPDKDKLTGRQLKDVRWIPEQLAPDQMEGAVPGWMAAMQTGMSVVNEPFRVAMYGAPRYWLNLLGNKAMRVLDQGFWSSGRTVAAAQVLEKTDGVRVAAAIRAQVGQGRSRAYVNPKSSKVSHTLAEWWQKWTDRDERVASWLYYAERKGYDTPEKRARLFAPDGPKGDLAEITRRANKALVEFDNLTAFEKNVMRHLVFVYPWQRGSAIWSVRAIMEHPAKASLLAQFGAEAQERDPYLDEAVAWYKRTGYVPFSWGGKPYTVNPASINTWATFAEMMGIAQATTTGDDYSSVSDVFGPAASFGIRAAIGRDEYGQRYEGNQLLEAAKEVLVTLPYLAPTQQKDDPPLKQFNVKDRASLEASLNSALDRSVFRRDWLTGYLTLIGGGVFTPKELRGDSLAARHWAAQDPDVRNERSLDLLNRALDRQARFLGRPVPAEVRARVREAADITYQWHKHTSEHAREPTEREKTLFYVDYYKGKGRLTPADQTRINRALDNARIPADYEQIRSKIADLAGARALREWQEDVVTLADNFRGVGFDRAIERLHTLGLSPQRRFQISETEKLEFGRQYLAYKDKVVALEQKRQKGQATKDDLRLLADQNSDPTGRLPSLAAMEVALRGDGLGPSIAATLTRGWGTLTRTEKQMLGRDVPKGVMEAWRAYRILTSKAELAKQLPAGQRSLDADQKIAVVKQIDRHYKLRGAFLKDYLFDREPLYRRLPYLRVVQESPHRPDWDALLAQAAKLGKAVEDGRVSARVAGDAWDDYTAQLTVFYEKNRPAFWDELEPILDANPDFLRGILN